MVRIQINIKKNIEDKHPKSEDWFFELRTEFEVRYGMWQHNSVDSIYWDVTEEQYDSIVNEFGDFLPTICKVLNLTFHHLEN